MSKNRVSAVNPAPMFDQVAVVKADGTKEVVNDISRFNHNSEGRYRQDIVMSIPAVFNAGHVVGKLTDGKYVVGAFKRETIAREATIVVTEAYDKPVVISIGTLSNPKAFVADFDATQARGTMTILKDCNVFIDGNEDDIIATVAGADGGVAGRVEIVIETSKLGASTYMPSN